MTFLLLGLLSFGRMTAQSPDPYQLRGKVLEEISQIGGNRPYAMMAEFERQGLRAAFFWPYALLPSGRLSSEIKILIYRKGSKGWEKAHDMLSANEEGLSHFFKFFGNDNQIRIHRPKAPAFNDFAAWYSAKCQAILKAMDHTTLPDKQHMTKVMAIAEEFSTVFSLNSACYTDGLSSMVKRITESQTFSFEVFNCSKSGDTGACDYNIEGKNESGTFAAHGYIRLENSDWGWQIVGGNESLGKRP